MICFCFFKQKTAYVSRISDWSSDVGSSDLKQLDWKRVTIIPTDDRLVPMGDPLSNVTAMAKVFLPVKARVMPITSEAASDYRAAGRAADARQIGRASCRERVCQYV